MRNARLCSSCKSCERGSRMSTRIVIVAAAGGLVLAGCAIQPFGAASRAECDTANNRQCVVEIVRHPDGRHGCNLGRFNVVPEVLDMKGRGPVVITWRLPSDFAFCGEEDGINLPLPLDRLEVWGSLWSKDRPRSPVARLACDATFSFAWPTDRLPAGKTYPYGILFRDREGSRSNARSTRGSEIDPTAASVDSPPLNESAATTTIGGRTAGMAYDFREAGVPSIVAGRILP
jgi:hypothetical protein